MFEILNAKSQLVNTRQHFAWKNPLCKERTTVSVISVVNDIQQPGGVFIHEFSNLIQLVWTNAINGFGPAGRMSLLCMHSSLARGPSPVLVDPWPRWRGYSITHVQSTFVRVTCTGSYTQKKEIKKKSPGHFLIILATWMSFFVTFSWLAVIGAPVVITYQ